MPAELEAILRPKATDAGEVGVVVVLHALEVTENVRIVLLRGWVVGLYQYLRPRLPILVEHDLADVGVIELLDSLVGVEEIGGLIVTHYLI